MKENLVKSSFLEMCSMCNIREGDIAWNCIVLVLFNEKWLKDLNVFCVSLFY